MFNVAVRYYVIITCNETINIGENLNYFKYAFISNVNRNHKNFKIAIQSNSSRLIKIKFISIIEGRMNIFPNQAVRGYRYVWKIYAWR